MVILAGLAAGCRHQAGRGRWGLLESGGGMVTGLVGAEMGPSSKCHRWLSSAAPTASRPWCHPRADPNHLRLQRSGRSSNHG